MKSLHDNHTFDLVKLAKAKKKESLGKQVDL